MTIEDKLHTQLPFLSLDLLSFDGSLFVSRDVGAMGEFEFARLCNAAGLTPNIVRQDKKGWDIMVQFPLAFSDSLDLTPLPIKAFVQVKATDDRKKKTQNITLLNMLNFVKDPTPCFLCQISFDGRDSSKRFYLMHVGEELIKNVLKMIRELQSIEDFRLNAKKFPVKFKQEHLLLPITAASLKKEIESYVPDGMEIYSKNKVELINRVGYEEGNARGTFTVKGGRSASALLDLSLGIIRDIDVEDFTLFEQRFGICSPHPIIKSESGKFLSEEVQPNGRARVKFSDSLYGPGILFDANWYASPFNAWVSEDERKFRIANLLIEMIAQPFKKSAFFNIFPNYRGEKLKLSDLRRVAELLRLLNNTKEELHVSIEFFNKAVVPEPNSVNSFIVNGVLNVKDSFKSQTGFAEAFIDAYEVAKLYHIQDDVEMSLEELEMNESRIREFHDCVIDTHKRWFKVEFGPDMDYRERSLIEGSDKLGCIAALQALVGPYRLICIFVIIGEGLKQNGDGRLELLSAETGYHRYLVFKDSEFWPEEKREAEFNRVAEKLNDDGITAIRITQ